MRKIATFVLSPFIFRESRSYQSNFKVSSSLELENRDYTKCTDGNNQTISCKSAIDEKETQQTTFVVSKAKTATFMLYWPSITTFTLVQGWNQNTTVEFKAAVNEVVNKNPILTGRASKKGTFIDAQIIITTGAFPTASHEFVNVLDYTNTTTSSFMCAVPDLCKMDEKQILHFMDDFIAPIVPKAESVIESISNGSPLFYIDLALLPGGYACYVIKMSHCVGDGVCYFKITEQINHCFNGSSKKDHDLIDWINEDISKHEVYPSRFSPKDAQIMYGFPFLLGMLRNFCNMHKQQKGYFLLSKKKIQEKKKEYMSKFDINVSTNDIITTAVCEANLSTDLFAFTMNMRSLHCRYGGNYHNEVPFSKQAVLLNNEEDNTLSSLSTPLIRANPPAFREIIKKGYYYDRDEIPICPFILGTVGRISSLASIQKLVLKDDMKLICHAMLSSFVSNVPMDTAFVSSMDDKCFVVLHNFRAINEKGLLNEISM